MNITSLTTLITALRQETSKDSITPELLGSLLQRIADTLATAALESDVNTLALWKASINALGTIINSLSITPADAYNVYIASQQANLTTGLESINPKYITISPATTAQAGAMSANHVNTLDRCTSNISALQNTIATINGSLSSLSVKLTSAQSTITYQGRNINSNTNNITTLKSTTTSLQNQLRTLQSNFNTFASIKQTAMVWIECCIKDGSLFIDGADQLLQSGLTPVIFRYSTRSSRTHKEEGSDKRPFLPERRGWNRFYDDDKLQIDGQNQITFRDEQLLQSENKLEYSLDPKVLFSKETVIRDTDGTIKNILIYFGKTATDVLAHPHRFRFALAFYKKTTSDTPTFHFSSLRTNLAEFRVVVKATLKDDTYEIIHYFSL